MTYEVDYTSARCAAELQFQLQFVFVENVCRWRQHTETDKLGTFVSSLAAKSDDNHMQLVSLTGQLAGLMVDMYYRVMNLDSSSKW